MNRRCIVLLLLLLLLLLSCAHLILSAAHFSEQLLIRPLEDGSVLTHFGFTVDLPPSAASHSHYTLAPKSLAQVIAEVGVVSLRLSLSAGRWRSAKWGYPQTPPFTLHPPPSPPPSPEAGPSGAELWVSFSTSPSLGPAAARHSSLLSSLTGLICASLNAIGPTHTSHPFHLHPPHPNTSTFYSTLPREAVCTENLTPLLKLLPCRNQRGLASLLHSRRLLASHYHSLQLHYEGGRLTVAVMGVVDPRRWGGGDGWTVQALFDEAAIGRCEVAHDSRVWLHLQEWVRRRYGEALERLGEAHMGDSVEHLSLTPRWTERWGGKGEDDLLMWDLKRFPQGLSLSMHHRTQRPETLTVPQGGVFASRPPVLTQRYLTGTDAYLGRVHTEILNHHNRTHSVLLYDTIPSVHTLPLLLRWHLLSVASELTHCDSPLGWSLHC